MKRYLVILSACIVAWSAAAAGLPSDLLLQVHFAGSQNISRDPESVAFTNLFNCTEAQALRSQTLDKLARFPHNWLNGKLAGGAGDGVAQLRPLLDDLVTCEWHLAVRNAGGRVPEFALAIRLPEAKIQTWQTNLASVLESWSKIPVQPASGGWQLTKHQPPVNVRFERVKGWTIFSAYQNDSPLDQRVLTESANPAWLSLDADADQLAQLWPETKLTGLPTVHLDVTGHQGNLIYSARALFAQAAPAALDAWTLPTNSIHEPFVSFTAARGFAPWLQQQSWFQPYAITPLPDQLFAWAMPQAPFQSFWAVPVGDVKVALNQVFERLNPLVQAQSSAKRFFMPLTLLQTNSSLSLQGVPPFVDPKINGRVEPAGQFLVASLFPFAQRPQPFPAPLLAEINKPGLVFYHWEMTSERLPQMLQMSQLALLMTRHNQLNPNSAAAKWITRITPMLGSTVTEIFSSGGKVLSGQRSAPVGLTAEELYAVGNWLEAPNFPGCDLRLPPPPPRLKLHRPMPPGAVPAPPAPGSH